MKPELSDQIYAAAPILYSLEDEDRLPYNDRPIHFECGDGWFDILLKLSSDIEELGHSYIEVTQVKEKFGGLRFYVNHAPETVYKLIAEAERMSYHTCEVCGDPGILQNNGWYSTLCGKHAKEI